METIDTTIVKTFANFTDFTNKVVLQSVYVQLSNGWFVPVDKVDLKKVADAMSKNGEKFCGKITYLQNNAVQVTLA